MQYTDIRSMTRSNTIEEAFEKIQNISAPELEGLMFASASSNEALLTLKMLGDKVLDVFFEYCFEMDIRGSKREWVLLWTCFDEYGKFLFVPEEEEDEDGQTKYVYETLVIDAD